MVDAGDPPSTSNGVSLLPDLDLTGEVEKMDSWAFESGEVADIYLGSTMKSKKIQSQRVAIKIFRRIHMDRKMLERAIRDIYVVANEWSRLKHPNVLGFLGISVDLGPSPALITPFCQFGSIMKYLTDSPKLPQERLGVISDIANGLAYLHTEGVVHGNLTTRKILINDAGIPVISGYGLAHPSEHVLKNTMISRSARFTAPEYYIKDPGLKPTAGDVYSFSMVVLEIMSGVQPFHDLEDVYELVMHIKLGGRPSRSKLDPLLVSDHLWGFLTHLWSHQPSIRPDMNGVILTLQTLSRSISEEPDDSGTEPGPSALDSVDELEEVSFGHPWLSDINSQILNGRIVKTDEYPVASGGNSNIYRGQLSHNNGFRIQVAIKLIRVSNDGSGQLSRLLRRLRSEAEVWSRLIHRNVLPFFGVWEEPTVPALISPFYKSGDLQKYLRDCPTADKEKMVLGVAYGLEYLHRHEIVHGDLKVHNVLIDKHGTPCICDFGISKIVNSEGFSTPSVGTPPYMAPELFLVRAETGDGILDGTSTTMRSDVYSFGLLVLEVWTNESLKNRPKLPILTAQAHRSLRPKRSDYGSESINSTLWHLLDSCWEPDPTLRPTVSDFILRMPFDTSETKIIAQFSKVHALSPLVELLCGIIHDCQMLSQNRHTAGQLANRCYRLLLELLEQYTDAEAMHNILNGVTKCLFDIRAKLHGCMKQIGSRIRAILNQREVSQVIESCHSMLSLCSAEFQLIPHLDMHENSHFRSNNGEDHREILDFLAEIQNSQIIAEELLAAHQNDLDQLKSMMQQLLRESQIRGDGLHSGLSANLDGLLELENDQSLHDFQLRPGEAVREGIIPISTSGSYETYQGWYLDKEKVAIKVVRAVHLDSSLREFRRECAIWKAAWEVDQGKHVLPFYGYCQEDGPLPYTVSPWQSNGTASHYVKKHLGIDYIRLIKGIAAGLDVLHTMSLPVVHGNLRGSTILIDQHGNPLLADFGLSQIVENTASPFNQSRGVTSSYRWFAPELCVGEGVLSFASDVYSYGMTVLELFTHEQPYKEIKHANEVIIRACKGEQPPRPSKPDDMDRDLNDELWGLLQRCWAMKPSERPTVQDILSSSPLGGGSDNPVGEQG
ncbi:TKL/TKL-ccin protein kinase [Mycena venus]|uniref:TKL/TKL-ccin protein kinase n=1 Tax=Mycena venus TaxID=2733690 RepID=A0A8H6YX14_9AGAR|nr:TKL/TKL-ccin protein kinase [Mycena venus]